MNLTPCPTCGPGWKYAVVIGGVGLMRCMHIQCEGCHKAGPIAGDVWLAGSKWNQMLAQLPQSCDISRSP